MAEKILAEYGKQIYFGVNRSTVTEVNGTYTLEFAVVLNSILSSQLPELEPVTLPLTADKEYTVTATFEMTTADPDEVL